MNVTVDEIKHMVETNKNKEFVVYVPNKILYDKLMKMFGEFGIKWGNKVSPTTKNCFGAVKELCVRYTGENNSIRYSGMGYYRDKNYHILELIDGNEEPEEDDDVLAELLKKAGIEKNKPFYVEDNDKFTLYNPYVYNGNDVLDNETDPIDEAVLLGIILGKLKVRVGFPQVGDTYHFVDISGNIACKEWADKAVDYAMMYMGNVFPSHSAAFNRVEEFKHIYKSLKNK